jgi:hypothetical protein
LTSPYFSLTPPTNTTWICHLSTVRDGISGVCLAWEGFLDDNNEDLGKVVDTDRLHRKKVLANQATCKNVYTSVHNLHTLCCKPVCTAEPV